MTGNPKTQVVEMWHAGGSLRAIGRAANLHHGTVLRWLRESGIDTARCVKPNPKICRKCGVTKPRHEFSRNGGKHDARKSICIACMRANRVDITPLIAKAVEMWHAGGSLRTIGRAVSRNCRTVSSWLRKEGLDTARRCNLKTDYTSNRVLPELYGPIGSLPPDHPMYEIDQEMARAKANPRSSANPWPSASSLV